MVGSAVKLLIGAIGLVGLAKIVSSASVPITITPPPGQKRYRSMNLLIWENANDYSSIDYTHITEVCLFSWNSDANGNLSPNSSLNLDVPSAVAAAHAAGVKIIFTIGGSVLTSATITSIIGSSANRANLVNSAISILNQYHLDGVKLDFENPPYSSSNFFLLVQELSSAITAVNQNNYVTVDTADYYASSQNLPALEPYVAHFLNELYNGSATPLAECETSMNTLSSGLADKSKMSLGMNVSEDSTSNIAAKMQWANAKGFGCMFWNAQLMTAAYWNVIDQN